MGAPLLAGSARSGEVQSPGTFFFGFMIALQGCSVRRFSLLVLTGLSFTLLRLPLTKS